MQNDPIVIVGAARTPMGGFQGDFSSLAASDLGAVAIKAQDQFPRKAYPAFVLYPHGEVKPLRVREQRPLEADSHILRINPMNVLDPMGTHEVSAGQWAADVAAGEIFPIAGSPAGDVWQDVPGRNGAVTRGHFAIRCITVTS